MSGSEHTRAGARYKADRALFLLLCSSATYRSEARDEGHDLLDRAATIISEARRQRDESRAAIAKLRRPRNALFENIEKLRLAHQTLISEAASARCLMWSSSEKLTRVAHYRPRMAIEDPPADP